jgi:hypothetical protein
MVCLDGQYGNGGIVADLVVPAYVMRGKDYDLLDLPEVQARLAQLPDQQTTHPEMEPVEPSLTALASGFISFSAGKKVTRPLKETPWC